MEEELTNLIQHWLDHSSYKAELLLIKGHSTIGREQTHSFTRRQINNTPATRRHDESIFKILSRRGK
jgi:hypothetical protein